MCDHIWVLITHSFPPEHLCALFGFFLQWFGTTQCIIISFAAVSSFVLVVKEHHINSGKYDWKLLITAIGIPAIAGTLMWAFDYLGASEAW